MIDKFRSSPDEIVALIPSGATVLVGGFGDIGLPYHLLHALARGPARDLTLVSNNAGTEDVGIARLFARRKVSRLVCSFPARGPTAAYHYFAAHAEGTVEVELSPQGTLAERLRAGGAGLHGFFTPTAYGTELAQGKETRMIDGRGHVYEKALTGDFALVKASKADPYGNLRYRLASRNFNPIMAMAARCTLVEVAQRVGVGELDPDDIHTPGAFVDHLVEIRA